MGYANRPIETTTTERRYVSDADFADRNRDRIHWGAIFAGLVVAIATQLLLSALGAALGFSSIANSGAPRSNADEVGTAVGIWSIISLFISLFVGGWVTARSCSPIDRPTANLNGAILWATTIAIGAYLIANGVAGTFGIAASNAATVANQAQQQGGVRVPGVTTTPNGTPAVNAPNISAQQARDIAGNGAKAGWAYTLGSLLGLGSSILGSSLGARNTRKYTTTSSAPLSDR
jgi:hypothetical protein